MAKRITAFFVAGILLLVCVIPFSAQAANCFDVLVIFARGSGQRQREPDTQPQAQKFFEEIEIRAPAGTTIETQELVYPAVGQIHFGEAEVHWLPGEYRKSVEMGIQNAVNLLTSETARCPNQKYVLGGYSQGAHVMGDVLYKLPEKVARQVVYTALFGDPKFKANSFAARGDFKRLGGGVLEARTEEFPIAFRNRVHSWCKHNDGICENNFLVEYTKTSQHSTYQNREIPIAANEAAILLGGHYSGFKAADIDWNKKIPQLDVVFAFDSSTAAARSVRHIKSSAKEIVSFVHSLSDSARIGVVDMVHARNRKDITRTTQSLTNSKELAAAGMVSVRTDFLYDTVGSKQAILSGLQQALINQEWRPEATKAVYYVTRLIPEDPEFNPDLSLTFTSPQIISLARDHQAGPIRLNALYTHTAPASFLAIHKSLTDATGGRLSFFADGDFANSPNHLTAAMTKLKLDPPPVVLGPLSWRTNVAMPLSVAGVYDPDGRITNYEWDFNNDGVYDLTTDQPVTQHTFDNNYRGTVMVRVTNTNQQETTFSYAKLLVEIDETHQLIVRPSAPRAVQANRKTSWIDGLKNFAVASNSNSTPSTIELNWQPPVDDWDIEAYAIYGNDELIAMLPADQTQVKISALVGSANFGIAAVNQAGIGPKTIIETQPLAQAAPAETEESVTTTSQPPTNGRGIFNENRSAGDFMLSESTVNYIQPESFSPEPATQRQTLLKAGQQMGRSIAQSGWVATSILVGCVGVFSYLLYRLIRFTRARVTAPLQVPSLQD